MSLERFHHAQADPSSGYETALNEMRLGRKVSHWIWYIFPQLAGLGRSSTAQRYALRDFAETLAYLQDPVLRQRYEGITEAVAEQLAKGTSADTLMGGSIDALKLASSLTLFHRAAARLKQSDPAFANLAETSERILQRLEQQGYPRCQFTIDRTAAP